MDSHIILNDNSRTADDVISELLETCRNEPNNSIRILGAGSGIKKALNITYKSKADLDSSTIKSLLEFVWKYWDFLVDKICYDCGDILRLLIECHLQVCPICQEFKKNLNRENSCAWISGLITQLLETPMICKARFKGIITFYQLQPSLISHRIDNAFILSVYQNMGNVAISGVLSELICFDLEIRRTKGLWNFHIEKIIGLLKDGRQFLQAVLERLLPRLMQNALLRCDFVDELMNKIKNFISNNDENDDKQFVIGQLSLAKFLIFTRTMYVWRDFIPDEHMIRALLHSASQVRMTAWSLLSEHPKRTLPVSADDCLYALVFLETNLTEQEPSNRQKIIASLKKFLARICDVTENLSKTDGKNKLIDNYSDFVRQLLKISLNSLREGANFSRRIMALNVIDTIFKDGVLNVDGKDLLWRKTKANELLNREARNLLIKCLSDSFQLCQKEALRLLCRLNFEDDFDWDEFIAKTETMLDSLRTHDTISSGYRLRYIVSWRPDKAISIIERLILGVSEKLGELSRVGLNGIVSLPLHPALNSLAILLEPFTHSTKALWSTSVLKLCFEVAKTVRPVVHNLSPEGYVPDGFLKLSGDDAADLSQKLVVCCWRAHKEASSILALASALPEFFDMFATDEIWEVFNFYWLELTECRHCGAFESAVLGFEILCRRLWTEKSTGIPNPMEFLRKILDAIDGKHDLEKLCSSRRSAGLPHLVSSLCSTDTTEQALIEAMGSLLDFDLKTNLSRIHSLNVLRALFSHSALGEKMLKFAEKASRIGITGCAAANWNERNASAQLIAALRTRLFGVSRMAKVELHVDKRNQHSAFEFFSMYPSLYSFMMSRLSEFTNGDEFGLYPVMIFLSHLTPVNAAMNPYPLSPFVPRLMHLMLTLRSEKLRKLAVAAFFANCSYEDIIFALERFEVISSKTLTQNSLDGLLNMLLTIIERPSLELNSTSIRGLSENILKNLVANLQYHTWSDYVLSPLFILCTEYKLFGPLNYFLENPKYLFKFSLSIRPMAKFMVTTQKLSGYKATKNLEYEIYNYLEKLPTLDSTWSEYLEKLADRIIALCDSDSCRFITTQESLKKLLKIMLNNLNLLSKGYRAKLLLSITAHESLESKFSSEMINLLKELKMAIMDWKISVQDVEWLESLLQEDDIKRTEIILHVGTEASRIPQEIDIMPIIGVLLINLDTSIREKASHLLSPYLTGTGTLNPAICWIMLLKRYPNILTRISVSKDDSQINRDLDEKVFDECESNPYAELCLFEIFSPIDLLLERLKKSRKV